MIIFNKKYLNIIEKVNVDNNLMTGRSTTSLGSLGIYWFCNIFKVSEIMGDHMNLYLDKTVSIMQVKLFKGLDM
jgi:hypothetical protein